MALLSGSLKISCAALGVTQTYTIARTAEGSDSLKIIVDPGVTNKLVEVTFTYADIELFLLGSDNEVTVKTNSSSVPDDTLTIKAGSCVVYASNSSFSNPFTADVTAFYVTNAGSEPATIFMMCLNDRVA